MPTVCSTIQGPEAKPLRAKPFGALVHWFEIDTYQHREDSVRAKRAKNFNNSNHISNEMPHIATFVINFQPMTKLLGGGGLLIVCPPLQILRGTCPPIPRPCTPPPQLIFRGCMDLHETGYQSFVWWNLSPSRNEINYVSQFPISGKQYKPISMFIYQLWFRRYIGGEMFVWLFWWAIAFL